MKTPLGTEVDLGAGHIVLDRFPALRGRGTAPPLLGPCLLWPRSPILATAELLLLDVMARPISAWLRHTCYKFGKSVSNNSGWQRQAWPWKPLVKRKKSPKNRQIN